MNAWSCSVLAASDRHVVHGGVHENKYQEEQGAAVARCTLCAASLVEFALILLHCPISFCMQRLLGYENAAQVMYGDLKEQDDNYIGDVEGWAAAAASGDGNQQDSSSGKDGGGPAQRALSAGIARLLMQLQDNLEGKSRAYKNEAIAALFMMNNVHYVQWSVESSAALGLLGVEWLERHKDMVEDWGARYHDITWMPIINMLKVGRDDGSSRITTLYMLTRLRILVCLNIQA
jgi:hypothetical protein